MMKTKIKSQNPQNGYQVHTNQKAGLICEAQMDLVDRHIEDCARNPNTGICRGIARNVKCMVDACQNQPIPCPL